MTTDIAWIGALAQKLGLGGARGPLSGVRSPGVPAAVAGLGTTEVEELLAKTDADVAGFEAARARARAERDAIIGAAAARAADDGVPLVAEPEGAVKAAAAIMAPWVEKAREYAVLPSELEGAMVARRDRLRDVLQQRWRAEGREPEPVVQARARLDAAGTRLVQAERECGAAAAGLGLLPVVPHGLARQLADATHEAAEARRGYDAALTELRNLGAADTPPAA